MAPKYRQDFEQALRVRKPSLAESNHRDLHVRLADNLLLDSKSVYGHRFPLSRWAFRGKATGVFSIAWC